MYSNALAILSSVSAWPVLDWDWPWVEVGLEDLPDSIFHSALLRDDTLEHTHHEPAVGCYCCHMQLTEEQRDAIIAWAERTPQVQAVMLFGSRCKGTARSDSDVDLALTMTKGRWERRFKNYRDNVNAWERELTDAVGLTVYVRSRHPALGPEVPAAVKECSISCGGEVGDEPHHFRTILCGPVATRGSDRDQFLSGGECYAGKENLKWQTWHLKKSSVSVPGTVSIEDRASW